MNDTYKALVSTLSKALEDTQRERDSVRAIREQLASRLHAAALREEGYLQIIRDQLELIRLLEGDVS